MPIKELIPIEPVLKRIWEARPLLKMKQDMHFTGDMRSARDDEGASLGVAHRMYSLGLDSLVSGADESPRAIGIRVYEMSRDAPRAFFDVSEGEDPRLLQMSAANNHLEAFSKGLAEVLSVVNRSEKECELRLLRVPALNFEALWINYDGEAKDLLVPLRGVGRLAPFQTVPLEEALAVLREATRPLAKMDDTMGA